MKLSELALLCVDGFATFEVHHYAGITRRINKREAMASSLVISGWSMVLCMDEHVLTVYTYDKPEQA